MCHWKRNSIFLYDKLFLLYSYNLLHKYDIICLSQTCLDSNTPVDNDNLEIFLYFLVRSDHPSNTKRGGVCLYYNISLPVRVKNIGYFSEYQILELPIGDEYEIS